MLRILLALCTLSLAVCAPAAQALSFDALVDLIADHDVRSIDQLLPLLPDSIRSSYALMFRSRSLHGASFENPRVILYGSDARLIVTFNGDPGQAGYNALETMEFDAQSSTFAFREIAFPADAAAGGAVRISVANPATCVKCHGSPARPIWDTHPAWPGAYGERYQVALAAHERDGLARFLQSQPTHPRYRQLLDIERFARAKTFGPGRHTQYSGAAHAPPNVELAALLGRLNSESIVHELALRPQFDAYRYVLLAALQRDCGSIDEFFPTAMRPTIARGYPMFVRTALDADERQQRAKQLRMLDATDTPSDATGATDHLAASGAESFDPFRFVVERGFGIPTGGWTLALEKGTFDLAMSPSSSADISGALLREVARRDAQIVDQFAFHRAGQVDQYCAYLLRRSRASLAAAALVHAPLSAPAPANLPFMMTAAAAPSAAAHQAASSIARPALLARCIGCHDQGDAGVGPALPFDRPQALSAVLGQQGYAHGTLIDELRFRLSPAAGAGRMPLGINPSDAERAGLEDYFFALLRLNRPGAGASASSISR